MAWNDLASNQIPTFTDLQTSGFNLNPGQSAVTSNQCVVKSEALAKYSLVSFAMSSFASNQLVPKSAYASSYSYSVKLGTDTSSACSATPITVYSDYSSWGTAEMGLWTDPTLTTGVSGYNYAILSSETLIYNLSSSESFQYLNGNTSGNCSTATEYRAYGYDEFFRQDACPLNNLNESPQTVYAATANPLSVTQFYNNIELTNPWTNLPGDGYAVSFSTAADTSTRYAGFGTTGGAISSVIAC